MQLHAQRLSPVITGKNRVTWSSLIVIVLQTPVHSPLNNTAQSSISEDQSGLVRSTSALIHEEAAARRITQVTKSRKTPGSVLTD